MYLNVKNKYWKRVGDASALFHMSVTSKKLTAGFSAAYCDLLLISC